MDARKKFREAIAESNSKFLTTWVLVRTGFIKTDYNEKFAYSK